MWNTFEAVSGSFIWVSSIVVVAFRRSSNPNIFPVSKPAVLKSAQNFKKKQKIYVSKNVWVVPRWRRKCAEQFPSFIHDGLKPLRVACSMGTTTGTCKGTKSKVPAFFSWFSPRVRVTEKFQQKHQFLLEQPPPYFWASVELTNKVLIGLANAFFLKLKLISVAHFLRKCEQI